MTCPASASHDLCYLCGVQLLEKKLDDELAHVRQLEEEKERVEGERTDLEAARQMLEAQKSAAELEKASAGCLGRHRHEWMGMGSIYCRWVVTGGRGGICAVGRTGHC